MKKKLEMSKYLHTEEVMACPMTRGEYNLYRGLKTSKKNNPAEEGYLIELDRISSNDERHAGYITWFSKEEFDKSHKREILSQTNPLHEFFNSRSDASPLEATEQEALEKEFGEWWNTRVQSFEDISKPLVQYIAENHTPHTRCVVTSTDATLMDETKRFYTEEFIQD